MSILLLYGPAGVEAPPEVNDWGLPIGVYPYEDIVPVDDDVNVRNQLLGTRDGGTTQTAEDATSIDENGLRDQQITSLATTDPVVLWQMESKLAKFKDPIRRVEQVKLRPIVDIPDLGMVEAGFVPNVGQQINTSETAPGFADALAETYVIQRVQGSISRNLFFAEINFMVWPVAEFVEPPA